MRQHKQVSSAINSNRQPRILYLVFAAALFSILLFAIQSSFFAGNFHNFKSLIILQIKSIPILTHFPLISPFPIRIFRFPLFRSQLPRHSHLVSIPVHCSTMCGNYRIWHNNNNNNNLHALCQIGLWDSREIGHKCLMSFI